MYDRILLIPDELRALTRNVEFYFIASKLEFDPLIVLLLLLKVYALLECGLQLVCNNSPIKIIPLLTQKLNYHPTQKGEKVPKHM